MEKEEEKLVRQRELKRLRQKRYYQNKGKERYKNGQKEYLLEWQRKNKDKVKTNNKKSREKAWQDPEKRKSILEKNKKWRQANAQKQRAAQAACDIRRRLKNMSRTFKVKPEEKEAIYQFYLNCPLGYEVDHIIPLSRGGTHSIDNLQYLLPDENDEKGDNWLGIEDEDGAYDPNALIKEEMLEEELFSTKIPKWKKLELERKRLLESCEEALKMA